MLKYNEKQKLASLILRSKEYTRILFDGGSRSGKTTIWVEWVVQRAFQYAGSRQFIGRLCRNHAKQSLWNDSFRKYLRDNVGRDMFSLLEADLTIRFYNGSEIIIGGLDDAEHVEKVLGNEYITVVLNEATQLSYNTMNMLETRLAQRVYDEKGNPAIPKMVLDCNPRGPRHWLHQVGVRRVNPETEEPLANRSSWARLHWSAYDNRDNLPPEYILSLESLPEVMKKRMLHGLWVSNEGCVYDEWDDDVHAIEPFAIPDDWIKIRAIDFGYTNPFVCLWGAVDPDGRIYIYRELYRRGLRTVDAAKLIKRLTEKEKIFFTVADHDAQERAELESGGVYTEAAHKSVMLGIQTVKNRLAKAGDGKPRLFIFNNLKAILSEISSYEWAPSVNGGNTKDAPKKENDHAMDALRYMVMACSDKLEGSVKNLIKMAAVDEEECFS